MMDAGRSAGASLAIIVKGYPRLSETFIAQEIHGLERRGLSLLIVSLRRPTDRLRHPVHGEIAAPVLYLPEYLYRAPLRVLQAWRALRQRPAYRQARGIWLADLRRDFSASRVRRFGQALVLAHEMPATIGHLHAHFLHTPSSVGRYAARLAGLSWTASAHAVDVWTTPAWELTEKLGDCHWAVTCTALNQSHLRRLAPDPDKVALIHHGLDLSRFPPSAPRQERRDGTEAGDPVRILSVGRAVEKKGYGDLLAALARLPKEVHWRFEHVGDGPLLAALRAEASRLGLAERIHWHGARAQAEVIAAYRRADFFVLASRVAANGDRDGLPNVLIEAQALGLACLSTSVSAIPELIVDGESGLLARAADAGDLAGKMNRLIGDPALRRVLGRAGMARARTIFSFGNGIDRLAAGFRARLDGRAARVA